MKRRPSFLPSFIVFYISLTACLGIRTWLKLTDGIDPATGFYEGGGLFPAAFNIALGSGVILLLMLFLFRDSGRDYPVYGHGKGLAFLCLITGFSVILYQTEALRLFGAGRVDPGVRLDKIPLIVNVVLGILAAWSFVWLGGRGLRVHDGMYGAVIPVAAGIWQLVALVTKFNGYPAVTTISDNLTAVLFMMFSCIFLVGHAKTLSGLSRPDGRNYAIPAGLCAALCGFVTVLPNWLWMLANKTGDVPAPTLGLFESFFIFILSLYALCFTISLAKSIRAV